MADDELRRLERAANGGEVHARRRLRMKRLELAPDDVSPLLPDLQLDAWTALEDDERAEVAGLFAGVLEARRRPMELVSIRRYGPDADQPIARYRDQGTGVVYALIPGGRFRPGLSEGQVFDNDMDELDLDYLPRLADEEVEVAPFLFAVVPVPVGCTALPETARKGWGRSTSTQETCYVLRKDVEVALASLGPVALPGARELEWAARGGREALFPWGDDLAHFDAARVGPSWSAPAIDHRFLLANVETGPWPVANRFGLVCLGGPTMWCLDEQGGLSTWSGAGENWPWQEPDRCQVSINGFVPPLWQLSGAIRPVMRIVAPG